MFRKAIDQSFDSIFNKIKLYTSFNMWLIFFFDTFGEYILIQGILLRELLIANMQQKHTSNKSILY